MKSLLGIDSSLHLFFGGLVFDKWLVSGFRLMQLEIVFDDLCFIIPPGRILSKG